MNNNEPDARTLLAAALAGLLPDEPLPPAQGEALRARILGEAERGRTRVVRDGEGTWQPFVPGIEVKTLRKDPATRTQTTLWRIAPGARIPPHGHATEEECLVLSGAIVHDGVRYGAGDYLLAEAGARHRTFTSPEGATLLIRGEFLPDPRA